MGHEKDLIMAASKAIDGEDANCAHKDGCLCIRQSCGMLEMRNGRMVTYQFAVPEVPFSPVFQVCVPATT